MVNERAKTTQRLKVKPVRKSNLEYPNRFEMRDILRAAREGNASDLHFKVNNLPFARVEGILAPIEGIGLLSREDVDYVVKSIVREDLLTKLSEKGDVDCSFEEKFDSQRLRYRVNVANDLNGKYVTIRLIPTKIREISEIGFPNDTWRDIVNLNSGLVLVTGVTGSGKTTTLASFIQEINRNREDNIVTLEDPIEYLHKPIKSIISQRELGTSLNSFGDGVKYALRQDPDIIMVGEIRDKETAEKAVEAAATGHLVFSTLHTNSTVDTVRRYVNLFPSADQDNIRNSLASNTSYIISQQLIPYQKGAGRTLAMEIMNVKDHFGIQNILREGDYKRLMSELQTNTKLGMISMDKHLEQLVREGKIEPEDAISYAHDRKSMLETLGVN